MSDHYRDFEESMTGRRPSGIGVLGWLAVAFFCCVMVLLAAGWMGYRFVRGQVDEWVEAVDRSPAVATARLLSRLDPELELAGDGDAVLVRNVQSGSVSAVDVADLIEGSLRVRTDEGEINIGLRGDESGGELVVETPDGRVTAELRRDGENGSLVVRSDDGEELRVGAGTEALDVPAWVPRVRGMPDRPRHIYSAASSEGDMGAVAFDVDQSPQRVLDAFMAELDDAGFESLSQSYVERGRDEQVSLWAKDEDTGRVAFVVAAREDGRTQVVVGYGEGR